MVRTWVASSLVVFAAAGSARAADDVAPATDQSVSVSGVSSVPSVSIDAHLVDSPSRGAVLPALYVSFAALQAYDGYSTMKGLQQGAVEANPATQGVAGNSGAMWAIKGASTGATFYLAERLWRSNHRRQALVVMIASNAVMAAVAAHNTAIIRR